MNATKRYQRLRETFRDAGQEHVFRFWERLGDNEKDAFLDQLETIDLDLVGRLASGALTVTPGARKAERRPIEVLGLGEEPQVCARAEGRARGEELLRQGKVGIYVVAGGQASRLGISAPKGFVEVGPISRRSLVFFRNTNAYLNETARRQLGYEPRITLDEGMQRVAAALGATASS